jgi:hypothetical protein
MRSSLRRARGTWRCSPRTWPLPARFRFLWRSFCRSNKPAIPTGEDSRASLRLQAGLTILFHRSQLPRPSRRPYPDALPDGIIMIAGPSMNLAAAIRTIEMSRLLIREALLNSLIAQAALRLGQVKCTVIGVPLDIPGICAPNQAFAIPKPLNPPVWLARRVSSVAKPLRSAFPSAGRQLFNSNEGQRPKTVPSAGHRAICQPLPGEL